jgi:hypothetical protein
MPSVSNRRRHCRYWLLSALLCTCTFAAVTSDLYVVCNPNVALRPGDVREVFIGEKSFAGAIRLAPADNLAAQATFLGRVVKFTADKYVNLWTKKAFRDGANPPLLVVNDTEAIAYVRQTPGACSYVEVIPPAGVAVVAKF